MSQVVTGVTQKLQDLLPNQIGSNRVWTTDQLERYILLADNAVSERVEKFLHSQEIELIADTAEYTLDSEFVSVVAVEYVDASGDYWPLRPATFDDFDRMNMGWRDDLGTRPEFYTLVSAPGRPTAAIHIYRPMSSVTDEIINVYGVGTNPGAPDHVQENCHVPYVMAMLTAKSDPRQAAMWFGRFQAGCEKMARRSVSKYAENPVDLRVGW